VIASGTVVSARASIIEARLPAAMVGTGVRIACARGVLYGRVAALCDERILVTPHGPVDGIAPGSVICTDTAALEAPLGLCALGRAFDAHGNALDGKSVRPDMRRPLSAPPPLPEMRRAIGEPFWTGVPAIDALLTVGRGARIGIFGGPGSGKSTLLEALARDARTDAVVIGLVGERGREAKEWLRAIPEHATIFCATGDRSAPERVRAAHLAMAQASALRSRGLHVLMIVDSLARFAAALRETAAACGESSGRAGYPPSVFAGLASFTEMAGACDTGSITLFATILHDGDDRDPVSEAARALLDGHVQLSPALAAAGKFPAIDVPASVSRTMRAVVSAGHANDAAIVRSAIVELACSSDARSLGMLSAENAGELADRERALEHFLYRASGTPNATIEEMRKLASFLEERRSNCQPA
jgi:type III secretion protein N (ATPase)